MITVGIVGATGYTGAELIRLLSQHPEVKIATLTSRVEAGRDAAELFPFLRGRCDVKFSAPDFKQLAGCDVVFFATPHGVAMEQAPALLDIGVKVIDLGADFRLRSTAVFQEWYGLEHTAPTCLSQAVYGLAELYPDAIAQAALIALPGCYPTAVQLGFAPLLEKGLVDVDDLIAACASGVSGAGRKAELAYLYAEVSENFRAYGATRHRHHPEITQCLSDIAKRSVGLTFTPHLVPMMRGIHASLYANLLHPTELSVIHEMFVQYYRHEKNAPFVDVMPLGAHPETRSVRHSNQLRIAIHQPNPKKIVVLVVEDNLVKGASGQAVQCMNLMFGLDQTLGLMQIAT